LSYVKPFRAEPPKSPSLIGLRFRLSKAKKGEGLKKLGENVHFHLN